MSLYLSTVVAVLVAATMVLAAVPPLRKEVLEKDASLIVTGRIANVTTTTREVGHGQNTIFNVEVEVASVEKGDAKVGQTVKAEAWKPAERPDGWVGPQGQNVRPEAGMSVRCYLRRSENDGYEFMEPNGLELLKPSSPATTQRP